MAYTGYTAPTSTTAYVLTAATPNTPAPNSTHYTNTAPTRPDAIPQTLIHTLATGTPAIVLSSTASTGTSTAPPTSTPYTLQVQIGGQHVALAASHTFSPGTALTLQPQADGRLLVLSTTPALQYTLSQNLSTFTRLAPYNTGIANAQQDLQKLLSTLTTQAPPHNAALQQQISSLRTLNDNLLQHIVPLRQLTPSSLAQLIQHSGIYLEAKLLSDHTTRNTGIELHPAQAKAIPDLKATLAQLLSIAKTLTNPFAAEQGAAASLLTELDHSNANNINTNANANVNANTNANKDIATIERQFNALLTQLMRAQQSPSSPGEANTLTNALALSALLSYLQQLQPNTRSPTRSLHANSLNGAAAQFNQTGWDLLLSLLAGSPRTHRQASPSASASLNSSNALLEGLIHKLEAKLSSIRSTQLHLLTQRENASETKTLCTSTLHIQTDTSIDQIPVHITQHETHSNTQHRASPDKVWTFQLGFDLEEKGIVFANGQYQDGSLMLTFQTANTSTQQHIAQNIAGLHAPLQQHGIVVSRVEIEAPPDASASSQVSTPCASDTMLTEIKLIDITL